MIISFANEDGGAGKTTNAASFAEILADRGKKVLLVDLTPKASLTRLFLKELEVPMNQTLYPAIVQDEAFCVLDTSCENIKILAGDNRLESISGDQYNLKLRERLQPYRDIFEYIIIDTANNGTLVHMAYCASDKVFPVIKPSRDSVHGALKVYASVEELSNRYEINIEIPEVFLNQYEDSSVSYRVEGELANNELHARFFNPEHIIPRNATVNSMQWNYKNVGVLRTHTRAGKALQKIASEIFA